jgi:hypothetical protein
MNIPLHSRLPECPVNESVMRKTGGKGGKMKTAWVSLLAAALVLTPVSSQTVNICGRVVDQNGKPLTNTLVRLGQTRFDNGYGMSPYYATTAL